jgi:hypothetical protein
LYAFSEDSAAERCAWSESDSPARTSTGSAN